MAYRLEPQESVKEGVRRIAREQVDLMLADIDNADVGRHETVHEVRKRCKKIRGLIRLVRPEIGDTYKIENAFFRNAARTLSPLRDATALLEAYDALMDHYGEGIERRAFGPIRAALTRHRKDLVRTDESIDERLADFRDDMETVRKRIAKWKVDAEEFDAVAGGLKKTYGRARDAMRAAYDQPTDERFHEWRKRVKYHMYHTRLLRPVWPKVMAERSRQLNLLSDLLGDDHDLAVFRRTVRSEPEAFGDVRRLQALLGLLDRRRAEFQTLARPLGRRLFAEKPKHHVRRIDGYWSAWIKEAKTTEALAPPRVLIET